MRDAVRTERIADIARDTHLNAEGTAARKVRVARARHVALREGRSERTRVPALETSTAMALVAELDAGIGKPRGVAALAWSHLQLIICRSNYRGCIGCCVTLCAAISQRDCVDGDTIRYGTKHPSTSRPKRGDRIFRSGLQFGSLGKQVAQGELVGGEAVESWRLVSLLQ